MKVRYGPALKILISSVVTVIFILAFLIEKDIVFFYNDSRILISRKIAAMPLPPLVPEKVKLPRGKFTSLLKPSDKYIVPNIVHFIWFGGRQKYWKFHEMLSVVSAAKNIKPKTIYFHLDFEPHGRWWKYVKDTVKNLVLVQTKPPTEIFGKRITNMEHKSDVLRFHILQKYGGIYLDADVLALKSFDPLRRYEFTMGIEYHGNPGRLNNGIIISAKNATFRDIWYSTYKQYSTREHDYHSCAITYKLLYRYPHMIHVEEKTLNYPSGPKSHLIYKQNYNWGNNYAMHLWWKSFYKIDNNPEDILTMNTTYGQMARFIFYGSPEL